MSNIEMLVQEIENFPPVYQQEVLNFVDYLKTKQKSQTASAEDDAYRAMAADTEREKEASEWCNAYFGPAVERR
jgi:protein-disulfide isomerase